MSSYEALYGRPCRTHVCWIEVGERKALGPELVKETADKIRVVRKNLKKAQDRQKSTPIRIEEKLFLKSAIGYT